jgi:hypothetical protein
MIKLKPGKSAKVKKEAKLKAKLGFSEASALQIRMDAARKRELLDRKHEKRRKKK